MAIIFENIDTKETVSIDRQTGGKFYRAKLSALMNSSNMNPNADRGQDFGWRLIPEQQATIELWESDPVMIDKISTWARVMIDNLTHSEFLAYLLYQQELGLAPEQKGESQRRANEQEYTARVEALKQASRNEQFAAFDPKAGRQDATMEDFLNGTLTGDASGDRVSDENETPTPPVVETPNEPETPETPEVPTAEPVTPVDMLPSVQAVAPKKGNTRKPRTAKK